jgi:two-component system OmpR family response regulator
MQIAMSLAGDLQFFQQFVLASDWLIGDSGAPQTINPMKIKDSIPSDTRQRILVVEDQPDIRRLNVDMLIWSGYKVDSAEDGAAAWELLQQNHYDLLITDNEMPNVTGVELLGKVHAAHMTLPVVMATGILPDFTSRPWIRPNAAVCKPYSFWELLAAVKETLPS